MEHHVSVREFVAFGIAAVLVIAALGLRSVPTEAAGTACDSSYVSCINANKSQSTCITEWKNCVYKKCNVVTAGKAGICNQDPDCKAYCTESGTSQGAIVSCCEGGPKVAPGQPNTCQSKADGKCSPTKTDGTKEGGQQGGGQGGQPPQMPQMPQGGGQGGGEQGSGQQPQPTNTNACAYGSAELAGMTQSAYQALCGPGSVVSQISGATASPDLFADIDLGDDGTVTDLSSDTDDTGESLTTVIQVSGGVQGIERDAAGNELPVDEASAPSMFGESTFGAGVTIGGADAGSTISQQLDAVKTWLENLALLTAGLDDNLATPDVIGGFSSMVQSIGNWLSNLF